SMVRELLPRARLTAMEGTYVAWLDLREYGITGSLHDHLLAQARVECTEGTACGTGWDGHVRLIYAMPHPLLVEAITRIARVLEPQRAGGASSGRAPAVIMGGMPIPPEPRPDQPDEPAAAAPVPGTGSVLFSHAPAPEPEPSGGAAGAEQTGWPWFLPQDGLRRDHLAGAVDAETDPAGAAAAYAQIPLVAAATALLEHVGDGREVTADGGLPLAEVHA